MQQHTCKDEWVVNTYVADAHASKYIKRIKMQQQAHDNVAVIGALCAAHHCPQRFALDHSYQQNTFGKSLSALLLLPMHC